MKVICSPHSKRLPRLSAGTLPVLLFGRCDTAVAASVGAAVSEDIRRCHIKPTARAWDFLSLALSVVTADHAICRTTSPDGWTREIELCVAVQEPEFWSSQQTQIERLLRFLTTDVWSISFVDGGFRFVTPKATESPNEESIALLSGGADSLVGAIDLVANGNSPFVVSQIAHGDGGKQASFAKSLGGGLRHFQTNHNAKWQGEGDRNQRARSLVFFAYAVLASTTVGPYQDGAVVPIYASENGLISINPPLTEARIGSLSTRTTHPAYIAQLQSLMNNADLQVEFRNCYRFKTKGEMLKECADQNHLIRNASSSTSCGKFGTHGLQHCGRCLPCLIRRAAFHHWGQKDSTRYKYADLWRDDPQHAGFDDVRSAAMAMATLRTEGVDALLGASLASELIKDPEPYREVVERGLKELGVFLSSANVR